MSSSHHHPDSASLARQSHVISARAAPYQNPSLPLETLLELFKLLDREELGAFTLSKCLQPHVDRLLFAEITIRNDKAPPIRIINNVTRINFSPLQPHFVTKKFVKTLQERLSRVRKITHLHVTRALGRGVFEILFKIRLPLTHVYVGNEASQSLSAVVFHRLYRSGSSHSLHSLTIASNGNDIPRQRLAKRLATIIDDISTSITDLSITGLAFMDDYPLFFTAISRCHALRSVNLSKTSYTSSRIIADILRSNASLRSLQFRGVSDFTENNSVAADTLLHALTTAPSPLLTMLAFGDIQHELPQWLISSASLHNISELHVEASVFTLESISILNYLRNLKVRATSITFGRSCELPSIHVITLYDAAISCYTLGNIAKSAINLEHLYMQQCNLVACAEHIKVEYGDILRHQMLSLEIYEALPENRPKFQRAYKYIMQSQQTVRLYTLMCEGFDDQENACAPLELQKEEEETVEIKDEYADVGDGVEIDEIGSDHIAKIDATKKSYFTLSKLSDGSERKPAYNGKLRELWKGSLPKK